MGARSLRSAWQLIILLGVVVLVVSAPGLPATVSMHDLSVPTFTPTVGPGALPTTTASLMAGTAPTPIPTVAPLLADIHYNELGKIMVLEYHIVGDQELRWARSRENFRRDLEYLYQNGYYLTGINDLIDNRVRAPAGKTPVVLTFDDSNRSQFQFIAEGDGKLKVDSASALGILEAFTTEQPDFGRSAVFCVLPGADPPNDLFGQPEYRQQKLQYLAREGYEICNHTLWHANLGNIGEREIISQLALATKAIQEAVPGYQPNTVDPPFGAYPVNLRLLLEGTFEGVSYRHRAILKVGGGPMTAPNHRETDFLHVPRIQAITDELDLWFRYFEQHPEERYVSDGDPDRVVFPAQLVEDYRPSPGERDESPPDASYKVIRLR